MKYVVIKMGLEKFRATVEAEVARVTAERGDALRADIREEVASYRLPVPAARSAPSTARLPGFEHWARTNARPQRQPGFRAVVVQVPLGDLTTTQMRAIGTLVREHGNGTLRATNDQNVVLPFVAEAALPAVYAALVGLELAQADQGRITDVVSCPGMDYCSLAITRSMGMAEGIRAHLLVDAATANGFAEKLGPFTVKISGCPNSCGQHHIGDLGLTGHLVKMDDGTERPFYSILVGGSVGEGRARVGKRLGRYLEEKAPAAIAALARFYERERQASETFPAFVDRVGAQRLAAVAREATGVDAAR